VEKFGELSEECADTYLAFGKCLLSYAQKTPSIEAILGKGLKKSIGKEIRKKKKIR
jgi:hypothetical protein